MKQVYDCRGPNRWGHSIEKQWGTSDKTKVQGCLTPVPSVGDYVVCRNAQIARFVEVEKMGNPRDGFFATVEFTKAGLAKQHPIVTAEQIDEYLIQLDKEDAENAVATV